MINCKKNVKPDITDELLESREKEWQKKLPDDFKAFIKSCNGGVPEKPIYIDSNSFIERFLCIIPKITESEEGWFDIDAIITKYDEYMVFCEDAIGPDLIPFAQMNHDRLLCLCYDGEVPSIVVWQLEGSSEFKPKYIKCFDSFSDFVNAI